MTRNQFVANALNVAISGADLNPFEIAALMAAIGTAVSFLVTECLGRLFHKDAKHPGPAQALALQVIVRRAVAEVAATDKGQAAGWAGKGLSMGSYGAARVKRHQARAAIHAGLIDAGGRLEEHEFNALMAGA